jgi:CO dehydrogenase nickel-insertion accessory protein CooC1
LLSFSVSKSIGNNIFFITNKLTDKQKSTDERLTDGDFLSVIDYQQMTVQIPTENSIDKSKDCGSILYTAAPYSLFDLR